jgi:Fe-S-cluster containining protein
VCGHDVWRISRAQRLAPEQFVVAVAQPAPKSDGFRLTAEGPTHGLMLDKQGRLKVNQSCVFLVHLGGDDERCGIYADRPVVCRSYPMVLAPRGVMLREKALCPPNSWPESELSKRPWRRAVRRATFQFDLYAEVVARWNARVELAPPEYAFTLAEYFSFLINVYERVAALDAELNDDALAQIELTWGLVPDPAQSKVRLEDLLWPEYHGRFHAIVDGFYPEVPPSPRPERAYRSPDNREPSRV